MIPEIIKDTEYVVSGVTDIFVKAITGIVLAFLFLIFSRYLDVVFGVYWLSNHYIFLFGIIIFSFYHIFVNYKQFTAYYLLGWILGIFGMVVINLITTSKALIYIAIPLVVLAIRRLLFH
ncbi:MAG: hypothetical protein PHX47_01815 [Candidatus ainarchaeum sp.]|nr:hypothetical protein [Candidatus ainarchaeum sp.]